MWRFALKYFVNLDYHSLGWFKKCIQLLLLIISPPFRLASTNTRMALTHSSKLSGVMWAASRTMKDSVSTHFMRDLVSWWPRSWPTVRLYWLTSGWFIDLEVSGGVLLISRSSFPTWRFKRNMGETSIWMWTWGEKIDIIFLKITVRKLVFIWFPFTHFTHTSISSVFIKLLIYTNCCQKICKNNLYY